MRALALIVGTDEWCAGALGSVLEAGGYRVRRAVGVNDARDAVAEADIVLVEAGSAEGEGIALCQQLRRDGSVAAGVPMVLISAVPTTRDLRVAGLRAGAWEVLALPMDAVELVARVGALVQVKRDADAHRAGELLEQGTGLYGVRGMERRSREVWADASRRHHPLACVVFGADQVQHLGATLQTHGRSSDVVGRWHEACFAILAPGTDAAGAEKLAQRLTRLVEDPSVRAGFDALDDAGASPLHARDLLARAYTAFQTARAQHTSSHVRRYGPEAPPQAS